MPNDKWANTRVRIAVTKSSLSLILDLTFRAFVTDFGKLCILAWKPFVILNACVFLFSFLASILGVTWLPSIGDCAALVITTSMFLLAVLRYRLLGWNDFTRRLHLSIGRRELRFVGIIAAASALGLFFYLNHMLILWHLEKGDQIWLTLYPGFIVGEFALGFAVVFTMPRFLLALPAIALDEPHPLKAGWKHSRGAYWKIFWIMFGAYLISHLLHSHLSPDGRSIAIQIFLGTIVTYIPSAFVAIATCLIYLEQLPRSEQIGP